MARVRSVAWFKVLLLLCVGRCLVTADDFQLFRSDVFPLIFRSSFYNCSSSKHVVHFNWKLMDLNYFGVILLLSGRHFQLIQVLRHAILVAFVINPFVVTRKLCCVTSVNFGLIVSVPELITRCTLTISK